MDNKAHRVYLLFDLSSVRLFVSNIFIESCINTDKEGRFIGDSEMVTQPAM